MNDLVVIEEKNALEVFTADKGLDPILNKIRAEIDLFIPNLTTKKGRDEIASMAFKVAKSKTYMDGVGKQLVDRLKEQPKLVDAERKRMRELLDSWRDEVRKPLTDWEALEEKRINDLKQRLNEIDDYINNNLSVNSKFIECAIDNLKDLVIDESWQEFTQEAEYKKTAAIFKLGEMLIVTKKREENDAELARLQAAEQERLKADEEERLRKEGEERARRQAERDAEIEAQRVESERKASEERERALIEAAEKAEREKQEAIDKASREAVEAAVRAEREKQVAIEAERKRIADEQEAERIITEKREANKRHVAKINNLALAELVKNDISEECAKKCITLIAKKLIPNIVINY